MTSVTNGVVKIRVPGNALDPEGDDVLGPASDILRGLYLLPTADELDAAGKPRAAFGGPDQSVAVIEAGATAFSKWWAAGLGTAVVAAWGSVRGFWSQQPDSTHNAMLFAAAIASAALIITIGYVIGSDVRGRAAAMVATIEGRVSITQAVVKAALGKVANDEDSITTPLPGIGVRYIAKEGEDEHGWVALVLQTKADGSQPKFFVAKGSQFEWADADKLKLVQEVELTATLVPALA